MNVELANELHWDKVTVDNCDFHAGVHTDVLRLDKLHAVVSGNKWFKLKNYLEAAILQGFTSVLSFGGAHSNHVVALAYAARRSNLNCIGIIRGEKPALPSASLTDAEHFGMEFGYLSREEYRQKDDPKLLNKIREQWGDPYIIPEGGYGVPGVRGAEEIVSGIDISKYSHIVCAVGTGTMLAGIANMSLPGQTIVGISVMKGNFELKKKVASMLSNPELEDRITFEHNYHFGGYAQQDDKVISFMNAFYLKTGIPTDFVYTAKLMYGIEDLYRKGVIARGSQILVVHSGGLQGNRSLLPGVLAF